MKTQREHHLQGKELLRLPEAQRVALEQTVPPSPQKEPILLTPILWASGLQNCEEVPCCCSSLQLVVLVMGGPGKQCGGWPLCPAVIDG